MKIFHCIFIVALVVLLMSAGCTTNEKSTGNVPSVLTDSSSNLTNFMASIPKDNTPEKNMTIPIVGIWRVQTSDQQIVYWQFYDHGKFTGGSKPGSNQITGNWSPFLFKNLFIIDAAGTDSNGKQIKYDNVTIAYDLTNDTASGVLPVEYKNWKFIRQPE